MILDCALGYRSWIYTHVALEITFQSILVDPIDRDRSLAMARRRCRLQ
jgi:hypothetical protein